MHSLQEMPGACGEAIQILNNLRCKPSSYRRFRHAIPCETCCDDSGLGPAASGEAFPRFYFLLLQRTA